MPQGTPCLWIITFMGLNFLVTLYPHQDTIKWHVSKIEWKRQRCISTCSLINLEHYFHPRPPLFTCLSHHADHIRFKIQSLLHKTLLVHYYVILWSVVSRNSFNIINILNRPLIELIYPDLISSVTHLWFLGACNHENFHWKPFGREKSFWNRWDYKISE